MKLLVVLLGSLIATSLASANAEFNAGLAAYQSGQWEVAAQHWENIIARGETSGELEYNLGNAYFRQNNLPRAILHYERARKYLPSDRDIEQNLMLANRGIVDQIGPVPRLGVWRYTDQLRDLLSPGALLRVVLFSNLMLAIALLSYRFGVMRLRPWAKRAAVTFFALLMISGGWYTWRASAFAAPQAIVFSDRCDVYSSPTDNSTQLFSLHEGTKVKMGELLSEWIEIELADGRKGWIPRGTVEQI